MATSTAAYSLSPHASMFQINTIAIQRASPTRIKPVRYSGYSGSSSHARPNISAGPTTQLSSRDNPDIFQFAATSGIFPYLTFASTGYIIHNRPIAIGRDTVSSFADSSAGPSAGNSLPSAIPSAIAPKFQTGKNRSSIDK